MRFNRCGRTVRRRAAFNHIGIERTLSQELRIFDAPGLVLENIDEDVTDDAAFFLRIADSRERAKKALPGVNDVQISVEVPLESLADRLAFALTQQAVIHEDAGHLRAESLDQHGCRDG